jgi:hypothetical protein
VQFLATAVEFVSWGGVAIALHKADKNPGSGGTIFIIQVALLIVSNTSLQRMVGTHG